MGVKMINKFCHIDSEEVIGLYDKSVNYGIFLYYSIFIDKILATKLSKFSV